MDCWDSPGDSGSGNIKNKIIAFAKAEKMTKRITILGGGESGVGTAILAKQKNYEVFVSDFGKIKENYKDVLTNFEIEWEENTHTQEHILNASLVMKSPGIPDTAPIIAQLKTAGIPVISEIEFASRFTDAIIVGITGSNGKTTTCLLYTSPSPRDRQKSRMPSSA